MKRRKGILVLVLLLAIGFASVTTTLILNGALNLGSNVDAFEADVIFTRAETDEDGEATISEDGKSITFKTKELSKVNDEGILEFDITNKNRQYDAEATINCNASAGDYTEYVEVTPNATKYDIAATETVSGSLSAKLVKSYTQEEVAEVEFTCTIEATAKERDTLASEEETIKVVSGDGRNLGDEICIGEECFYVISSDEESINLLAKYNLYVGGSYDEGNYTPYGNEATGMQDSTMIGLHQDFRGKNIYPFKGVTAYSSDTIKGENNSSYEGSIVEGYVNNYVNIIKEKYDVNVVGRLITSEELEELTGTENLSGYLGSNRPGWLIDTSYWTGFADDSDNVWTINTDGDFISYSSSYNEYFGVRPVIIMSADLIAGEKTQKTCKGNICFNDIDLDGDASLSDEISIGDEEFYVLSSDEENITMLSKYNLYVGGSYLNSFTAYGSEATGLQDSTMLGFGPNDMERNGVTVFSSTSQHGEQLCSYQGSIVEGYVNNYVGLLNEKYNVVATGRLLTKNELDTIAGKTLRYQENFSSNENIPKWVYSTSYWTGSDVEGEYIWTIVSFGSIDFNDFYSNQYYGVRPVITISRDLIK